MASNRARTRAVRARMNHADETYTIALQSVTEIRELAASNDYTFAEAQAVYDDPANQVACTTCGWTNGMLCSECPGCGCYNNECSGWRHHEFADEDDDPIAGECDDPIAGECDECGAHDGYGCNCHDLDLAPAQASAA